MSAESIGLVLCSSARAPLPSTRVAVLNMLPFLESEGMQPRILFEPETPNEVPKLTGIVERAVEAGCKTVIFQKVWGPGAIEAAHQLTAAGIRTIFVVCDRVDPAMTEATTATATISDYLKSLYPTELQSRVHVVHDGIERPEMVKGKWGVHRSSVRAVLVTSQSLGGLPAMDALPSWMKVRIVGKYQAGLQRMREWRWHWQKIKHEDRRRFLAFLLNPRIACVPWSPDGVYHEMLHSDIGIIPVTAWMPEKPSPGPPDWMTKSENRLTLKMSAGLPVVATPIPAYEAVIDQGRNGFLARTPRDWSACLSALRDPERRREMGMAARNSVQQRFSMEAQASKLVALIKNDQRFSAGGD